MIKGMDISMISALERQGACYYLNGVKKDVFRILRECGANMIRLRLWYDPYTEDGVAYGGGDNDLETTISLARRAKENGMDILLDFHYSDFWADPGKQFKPKAWEALSGMGLRRAVYKYTAETMRRFRAEGLTPAMVQVGNEITKGLLWPDGRVEDTKGMAMLLAEGIRGVRETAPEAKIVLHLDFGTDNKMYRKWFSDIAPWHLAYDVIGMSYYPYWNGSMEALLYNMNDISKTFQKEVLVMETAMGYTTDTLGCRGIAFLEEQEKASGYPATFEGQETFLRDLFKGVRQIEGKRGIGVFYWEPAWLPIAACTWANPEGSAYMKDEMEAGNSMGNQALFDSSGNANPALLHLGTM